MSCKVLRLEMLSLWKCEVEVVSRPESRSEIGPRSCIDSMSVLRNPRDVSLLLSSTPSDVTRTASSPPAKAKLPSFESLLSLSEGNDVDKDDKDKLDRVSTLSGSLIDDDVALVLVVIVGVVAVVALVEMSPLEPPSTGCAVDTGTRDLRLRVCDFFAG